MRKVAGEKPGSEVSYIPKAYGNRDDPEPMRILITVPTNRERRKLAAASDAVEARRDPDNPDGDPLISMRLASNTERQEYVLENSKLRVEGYVVYGIPIIDGPTMAKYGEDEIVSEMHDVIMGHCELTGDEVKKSKGSSDSSDQATPISDSTAPIVEKEGLRGIATAMV